MCVCAHVCVRMYVCVCVCERERERERVSAYYTYLCFNCICMYIYGILCIIVGGCTVSIVGYVHNTVPFLQRRLLLFQCFMD